MKRIAVTGAAGNVGRQVLAALDDEDVTPLDVAPTDVTPLTHREHDDIDGVVADITDRDALDDAFSGQDVVVHLAGNPSPDADWESVLDLNVDATRNVYEAALANGVERVVFASSNHAAQMYNIDDPADPETMVADARTVDHDDPPRPDSFYGVSKVAGEALGSYYADRHGIEVVNARIGWLMTPEELAAKQESPENHARFARAMWLSPRDCRDAMAAAATAPIPENPLTVNVVSRNDDRYFSLTHAMRTIGYRPRDNATETLAR